MTGPDPDLVELVLRRAANPDGFEAWAASARSTGWCRHPVRLKGSTVRVDPDSGEVRSSFASEGQPDDVLLKACGQRRATVCPQCSATYRADAFQLVAAGLRGGKGVPEGVASHPAVFATLTAPSFGPVHSSREGRSGPRPCRPDAGGACSHGRPRGCEVVHHDDDPLLGQPLCPDCFDYAGAVLWNALAGELWRRTTISTRRHLAALAGMPSSALSGRARLSFAKVVEYQRRGVVHVHAVARLDGAGDGTVPPPSPFGADLLVMALHRAVPAARVPHPAGSGVAGESRWGEQVDLHVVGGGAGPVSGVVAAYLAKYATKSTDPAGALDHRIKAGDLDHLEERLSPHLTRMVRTAWGLGGRPELAHLRLRSWAHTLGFRGHWLTKSRAYSTTFGALRAARHDWHVRNLDGPQSPPSLILADWRYAGRGWSSPGDAWLAETAAAQAADARHVAREEGRAASRLWGTVEGHDVQL